MHAIPSGVRVCLNKIAQNAFCRKLRGKTVLLLSLRMLLICVLLVCSSLLVYGFRQSCQEKWESGWKAWETGDAGLALKEWSAGRFFAPFDPGAPRIYYWKIRALERLGRKKEAETAASLLASRFPLDFYCIALARDGRYPYLSQSAAAACLGSNYRRRWEKEIAAASAKTGVSKNMLMAMVRQESSFNECAVSKSGAVGLMQLMPVTARETASRLKATGLSLQDPAHNIVLGASHFARLSAKFNGCLPMALAAYNAGVTAVSRWKYSADGLMEWIENIPYRETRVYVRAVIKNYAVYTATDSGRNQGKIPSFPFFPFEGRFSVSAKKSSAEK